MWKLKILSLHALLFGNQLKTRINKGVNTLFGFFLNFAGILILFNEHSKGLKKIVIFL